ncbi:MAG: helix-turn-helix domain-containing protein [Bacteroides uniformis]|nr:helix-turn-helix domain-containing protein [Bacteroides uniformis]
METTLMTLVPQKIVDELIEDIKSIKASLQSSHSQTNLGEEWIPSNEVLKQLGISRKTWQKYRDERRIPFSQFGRKIYVKRTDLEVFMENHKINGRG